MVKRIVSGVLIVALIVAFAYGLREKRTVTTSSAEAYREYCRGVEHQNKFYFEEALAYFERAVELDTDFAMAYCRQGLIHRNSGRTEEEKASLAKALQLAPGTTEKEQLTIAFHNAITNHDYDEARDIVENLAERYPRAIEPYDYRGDEYLRQREFERGIREYKRLLQIDPNYALAYNQIGYAYAYLGDFEEAVANVKKYAFIAPDQPNPYDSLGEIYLYTGRYDEAITEFNKARQLKPDFAFAIDHLGIAYRCKGMYRKAITYFEKGLDLCSDEWCRVYSHIEIARTHYEKGDYATSLAVLENTTAEDQQLLAMKWLRGLNLVEQGAVERARAQEQEMRALLTAMQAQGGIDWSSENIDRRWEMQCLRHLSGRIAFAEGLYENAADQFQNVIAHCFRPSEKVFFQTALAEALDKKHATEEALALLQEIVEINPNYAPSRSLLAHIYDEQGDTLRAASEMEKYLMIMDGCDEGVATVDEIRGKLAEMKRRLSDSQGQREIP